MIPLLTSMVSRLRTGLLLSCCWLPMFAHAQAPTWADGFSVEVKPNDRLTLMYSPYTYHFSKSDEHKYVWLVGVEREREDGRLSGITYFSNSFGQPSTYIFPWGQSYRNIGGISGLFAKWSGGLLYGYVEPYENKVPLYETTEHPDYVRLMKLKYCPKYYLENARDVVERLLKPTTEAHRVTEIFKKALEIADRRTSGNMSLMSFFKPSSA
jgi:hypothetical protein